MNKKGRVPPARAPFASVCIASLDQERELCGDTRHIVGWNFTTSIILREASQLRDNVRHTSRWRRNKPVQCSGKVTHFGVMYFTRTCLNCALRFLIFR